MTDSERVTSAATVRSLLFSLILVCPFFQTLQLRAATGGSISGTVTDPTGAFVPGAALKLVNTSQQTTYQVIADKQGFYSFPNLPVGHYELTISAPGFATQRKTNLTVDTDSALRVDTALVVGTQSENVIVTSSSGIQAETAATHLGEVVSSAQMTSLPLNGRSYTDLLAIQP